jgi:hypothetical protein
VRIRIIGAAFFDGEHRGGANHRDETRGDHGRRNSSVRTLWESGAWARAPTGVDETHVFEAPQGRVPGPKKSFTKKATGS